MSIKIQDIKHALQSRLETREPVHNPVPATVVEVDGSIRHPYKPNFVWVKLYSQPEGITSAHNNYMTLQAGLHVWVEESPKPPYSWRIVGVYFGGINEGSGVVTHVYNTAAHGQNHQIPSENTAGLDPVLIYQPAMQTLKTTATGGVTIAVEPHTYNYLGIRRIFTGDTIDLSPYLPGVGYKKRVLICLILGTNLIEIIEGDQVLDNGLIPVPYPEAAGSVIPSAYVTLIGGMSTLTTTDHIEDSRDFLGVSGGAIGATSIGQVMYSVDGITMTPQQPIIEDGTWLTDDDTLMVD